jgi:hypothetical protein
MIGIAVLLLTAGIAAAQTNPSVNLPSSAEGEQSGYATHHTADLGGHLVGVTCSGAVYDTLVNIHSGPRVLGQTFTMHALEGTKHPLMDDLTMFSSGFGGDPNNFAKMDMSKGKVYEFSGLFRRDRQYFDYNLLDSPNVVQQNIPCGMVNGVATAQTLPYQHLQDSGMMFNTVRRMTDTNLTILPLSKVTFRVAYSHNIFQGPSTMTNRSIGKYDSLLMNYQRNGTDDFTAAIDWKPFQHTKLTFEEIVDHYKADPPSRWRRAPLSRRSRTERRSRWATMMRFRVPRRLCHTRPLHALPAAWGVPTPARRTTPSFRHRRRPAACPSSIRRATLLRAARADSPRGRSTRPK